MNFRFAVLLPALFTIGLCGCGESPYAGPPDAGDVELTPQVGEALFVPVDEIRTFEQADTGTMVWVEGDSFVVKETAGEIRERMKEAKREQRSIPE